MYSKSSMDSNVTMRCLLTENNVRPSAASGKWHLHNSYATRGDLVLALSLDFWISVDSSTILKFPAYLVLSFFSVASGE